MALQMELLFRVPYSRSLASTLTTVVLILELYLTALPHTVRAAESGAASCPVPTVSVSSLSIQQLWDLLNARYEHWVGLPLNCSVEFPIRTHVLERLLFTDLLRKHTSAHSRKPLVRAYAFHSHGRDSNALKWLTALGFTGQIEEEFTEGVERWRAITMKQAISYALEPSANS